jgi:hypothetical protein
VSSGHRLYPGVRKRLAEAHYSPLSDLGHVRVASGEQQHRDARRSDLGVGLRHGLEAPPVLDRSQALGAQDRHDPPVRLAHHRPVRLLERRAPPSERLALEREVLLPRFERVLLDFLPRLGHAGGEICLEIGT